MAQNISVPDIGDFKDVEIIEVLVKPGDQVEKDDPIVTIESDKSSLEIPSPSAGEIKDLKVKIGDKVSEGSVLATIENGQVESLPKEEKAIEHKKEIPEQEKPKNDNTDLNPVKKVKKVFAEPVSKDDIDPIETNEWIDSLNSVIENDGSSRASYLLNKVIDQAYKSGLVLPDTRTTPYINTIPPEAEAKSTGDQNIEKKIRAYIRWNAAAMVVKANKKSPELGGHIGTFASAATLYDVGMNHFWRAKNNKFGGDLIYFQGHSAPGMYARAFLEGRLTSSQLDGFRQEVNKGGLSSYPHPWLMPKFWQFPTVSMGLGPIMSIYQARFNKYLINRGLLKDEGRKIWCFLGDGETDEPESLGAIGLAAREKLDNLIFVVNCNLQRLDGPVRGNGKIIQELEGIFRGAGWNVIKVIWGSYWDQLLSKDKSGLLIKRMGEAVDGEYQAFKAKGGNYVRDNFFGKYPELLDMVSQMTDRDIWKLNRGGHDPHKVYAAYHAAMQNKGTPTVILAKTIKGYGMGKSGESMNTTHQQKKLDEKDLLYYRDRFDVPLNDEQVRNVQYYRPDDNSPEIKYLKECRIKLGGNLPERSSFAKAIKTPPQDIFAKMKESTGEKEMSTTMVLVRMLTNLMRDKNVAPRLVPIIPDEA
ncbi:MAG: pyruvate dehydrogenase, partial [Candidatus Pelagibacter sp.]|nr:pyruvate dehydrogenase [Candidatus Pelagibacter sp.]